MAEATLRDQALSRLVVDEARGARDTRRWVLVGLLVVATSFGLTVAWSSLAPLASAVVASGAVKVESNRKKVQHPEGGVVKDILVQNGTLVRAGDVLVRLDETRAGAAHGVVTGGRDQTLATLARLQAERDERPGITFPPELLQRADQAQVAQALRAQEALFLARRNARAGELGILDQQIEALRNEITGFESQGRSKQAQLSSLESDLKGLEELDAQGMVEKTRLRALERDIARVRGEAEELRAKVASTHTAISEKELKKFQVRKASQEEVAAELKKVQAEVFELQERESATRRTLELTELRAPVDGTVTELKVHTAGGVISAGEVLMEIVPSADRLVLEARVMPADIDRVAVGQSTGIKLHAFNPRTTPELHGQVSYVAADATVDPRNDMSHFIVKVDVATSELARLGEHRVQPGMQADLFIRTGERTFLGYLLQPLTDSFHKAWRER